MSTRRRGWLFVAIFAVAVASYYPFSPGGRQSINMRRAERHIRTLQPQLAADPRFAQVRLEPFTAHGGSLGVFGIVASLPDTDLLKTLVEASEPPVPTAYRFTVSPPATLPGSNDADRAVTTVPSSARSSTAQAPPAGAR